MTTLWDWCHEDPLYDIAHTLSQTYGVSNTVVLIHLRTLGLLKNAYEVESATAQASIDI